MTIKTNQYKTLQIRNHIFYVDYHFVYISIVFHQIYRLSLRPKFSAMHSCSSTPRNCIIRVDTHELNNFNAENSQD